jgi:hypothetical protein
MNKRIELNECFEIKQSNFYFNNIRYNVASEDELLRSSGQTLQHCLFKGGPAIVSASIFTILWRPPSL